MPDALIRFAVVAKFIAGSLLMAARGQHGDRIRPRRHREAKHAGARKARQHTPWRSLRDRWLRPDDTASPGQAPVPGVGEAYAVWHHEPRAATALTIAWNVMPCPVTRADGSPPWQTAPGVCPPYGWTTRPI